MAKKNLLLTSPHCEFLYPKLETPDYGTDDFPMPDGALSVKLILDPENDKHAAFMEKLEELGEGSFDSLIAEKTAEAKTPKQKKQLKAMEYASVVKVEEDDEGEETGRMLVTCKVKFTVTTKKGETFENKVVRFDKRGIPLDGEIEVGSGSRGQASFEVIPYLMASSEKGGISLRLKAVMVSKLEEKTGGGTAESHGFDLGGEDADEDENEGIDDPIEDDDDGLDF
jgi:hypothetical protein